MRRIFKSGVTDDYGLPSADRYLSRLKSVNDYYIALIVFIGVAIAISVVIAIVSNVLLGAGLCVLSAVIYHLCAAVEAKKQIGLSYSHIAGRIHIKTAVETYGDELIIPKRLELADVTHICDGAFDTDENSELAAVYLPDSIEYVGKNIFGDREEFPRILFEGSCEAWDKIEKHTELYDVSFSVPYPSLPKKARQKKNTQSSDNAKEDGGV